MEKMLSKLSSNLGVVRTNRHMILQRRDWGARVFIDFQLVWLGAASEATLRVECLTSGTMEDKCRRGNGQISWADAPAGTYMFWVEGQAQPITARPRTPFVVQLTVHGITSTQQFADIDTDDMLTFEIQASNRGKKTSYKLFKYPITVPWRTSPGSKESSPAQASAQDVTHRADGSPVAAPVYASSDDEDDTNVAVGQPVAITFRNHGPLHNTAPEPTQPISPCGSSSDDEAVATAMGASSFETPISKLCFEVRESPLHLRSLGRACGLRLAVADGGIGGDSQLMSFMTTPDSPTR